ncbi:MAG TPA: DSD1 family PLP-dependent enzyme [Burkholderiaceae bacterium]
MPLTLPPSCQVGDPLSAIDTPALVIDLDAFERNVALLQARCDAAGVPLRPHAKAHKTPAISLAQIRAGAVGICCQKVSEALPFAQAGVQDIYISNEVNGPKKAALLAELARHARVGACVDHATQVADIGAAAARKGSQIALCVEVNIGQDRCGVDSAEALLALVDLIAAQPQLRFKGLQAYHGKMQHVRSHDERRALAARAAERTAGFVAALRARGISCEVVSGGGSGSAEFDLQSGVFNELQAGSYVFMDGDYGRNDYAGSLRFEHSLFIASSVMSIGSGERIVLDAGLKSIAVDSGLPDVWQRELDYVAANDEHGIVQARGADRPGLGDTLLLVPGHCDPTLNLHDELIGLRAGRVECIWPIAARGLSR